MTESERLFLTNRDDLSHLSNTSQHFDHFRLAAIGENLLQFGRIIEMILDAVLAPAGHEDDFFDSCIHRFLNDVLNRRNVDDRQKLLGDSFSSREKSCSEARHRYDRFSELHGVVPQGSDDPLCLALLDLLAGLTGDAKCRYRTRFKPFDTDLLTAFFADTVLTVV